MIKGAYERPSEKLVKYAHINPKLGNITVDELHPVVVMKKIKLGPTDASGLPSVTDFLPELTDADAAQDLESQRGRPESAAGTARPDQNEEVSFVHTLTQEELNDYVQKCLEMSSENKINQKNAYALKLIDCFSFLQKRKEDFSAMACTLDAGTKIYSCRVDALHQKVMRLADEIVVREKMANREGEDNETGGGKKSTTEQLRKWRKKKFIASSETLTREMKTRDPKDKYLRFEALPGAILSGARRDANDMSLSLERYTPFWPDWENYKPLRAQGTVPLPDVKIFREQSETAASETPLRSPESAQQQTDIEHLFAGDDDDDDVFEDNAFSQECSTPIVDIQAGEQFSANEGDGHSVAEDTKDNVVVGDDRYDGDEVGVVSLAMGRLREEAEAEGAVNRPPTRVEALKILFDLTSEYDYLNMKNCNYWAGPEFWKRPQQGRAESDKSKTKVLNKKKDPSEILYDSNEMDESLLVLSKKTTCLSERTVRSWTKKKTSLPPDLKVDSSWFLNLFHVENHGETEDESKDTRKPTRFVDALENFDEAEEITAISAGTDPFSPDHQDGSSGQDPLNATFYEAASGQSVNSEPRDPLESTFYDAGPLCKKSGKVIRVEVSSSAVSEFGESSMVPVPKMVKVVPIKYSTRPIRVDMRHLKRAMMEVIREEVEKDAREKRVQGDGSEPEVRFRDVLKSLPGKLQRRTREDLSAAIAFTAVLSLANENSLHLKNCDGGDFVVKFPDFPLPVSEEDSDVESCFERPVTTKETVFPDP